MRTKKQVREKKKERIENSQWINCLKQGSAVSRLMGLWVRTPPAARMFLLCAVEE